MNVPAFSPPTADPLAGQSAHFLGTSYLAPSSRFTVSPPWQPTNCAAAKALLALKRCLSYWGEEGFGDMMPPVLPYLICLAGPSLEEGASRWVGEGEARSVQVKAKEVPRR